MFLSFLLYEFSFLHEMYMILMTRNPKQLKQNGKEKRERERNAGNTLGEDEEYMVRKYYPPKRKQKLRWAKQVSKQTNKCQGKTSHRHMLPALPGVVFAGLNLVMSTRSPNSLSSGLDGFPDGRLLELEFLRPLSSLTDNAEMVC